MILQLLMRSQSLNGFGLFYYWDQFDHYLPKLISMISDGSMKAKVDLGESSPGGKFLGIEQTYRAEEWLHSGKNLGKVVVQLHEQD